MELKSIVNKMDYDEKYDILYYAQGDTSNSYGDEIDSNLVVLRDMDTDQVTGATITGFKKLYKPSPERQKMLADFIDTAQINCFAG